MDGLNDGGTGNDGSGLHADQGDHGDQRIAQGRENTRKYLKDNPAIAAEIDALVRAELMGKKDLEAPMIEDEEDDEFDDLPLLGADDE